MKHVFHVQGMTCGHCERAIQQAIAQVDADAVTHIDRTAATVSVESEKAQHELAKAIEEEGYRVS